ncbi:MAG TPA: VOC family protein [Cryobacterium sp.]|nr:VOC family protein [Cryobacterium sp.]
MLYELNHFGIVVRDLDASLAFYEGVLGAKTVFRRFVDSTQTHVLYLQLGDGLIELLYPLQPAEDADTGITHIAFMTDDLDGDYTALIHAGVESISEPKTTATGVGRLAFVRDPNGVGVELLQRDLLMRGEAVEHPIVAGFDHYSLTVADPAASHAFYAGLLDMRPADAGSGVSDAVYLELAGQVLELQPRTAGREEDPTFSHFALRVDGIRSALDALASSGVDGEMVGGEGEERAGVIRDPDGVAIYLVERAAALPPSNR